MRSRFSCVTDHSPTARYNGPELFSNYSETHSKHTFLKQWGTDPKILRG